MASASTLPNLYQGVEKESFGYKLLANLGWKEGQGLGANKQGIKEHLKVKKKQDALGVGAAEHAHKLRDWTTGMVGYDAILTGLKEITRGGPSSSNDGSSSSSDEDDSSEQGRSSGYDSDSDTSGRAPAKPAAAAAAAAKQESQKKSKKAAAAAAAEEKPKKRGKKQQDSADAPAAKRAKKAARSNSSSEESGSDSDSDAEPAAAAAAAAGGISVPTTVSRVKAASHLGRYSKREKAKTVRNYSANDLAAILGLPGSAPPVANGEGAAGWAAAAAVSNPAGAGAGSSSSSSSDSGSGSSSSDSDSDSEAGGERDSSDQRLRPSTPPGSDSPPARSQQRGLGGDGKNLNLVVDEELQPVSDEPEDAAGQRVWWRSIFVRAGRTGGGAPAAAAAAGGNGKQRINISGFQEDDQTNLYMQAQEGATKGKQGLGRSSMPKKVAGTRWQGKKVRLGSDSEDEAEEQQQQQQQGENDAAGEAAAAAAAATAARTYVKNGITIVMPVKREQQQQQQQEDGEAAAAAAGKAQKKEKKQKQSKQQEQQQDDAGGSKPKKQQQEEAAAAGAGSSKKRKQQQQQQQSDEPAAAAAAAAAAGSSQKKSKKAKQEQQEPQQQQQQQVPQVKWAKLAAKILEGAPKKRMRVQKLHRKVVAAAGYDVDAPGVDTEQLFAQMLRKLRKAEGLAVCEKYVGLAS